MILDVYVNHKKVGVLQQHSPTSFAFSYLPNIQNEYAVSLLMPPRNERYTSSFLFPVFQVSLPEGFLRQQLERDLANQDKPFDDMGLLASVGHGLVGRVKVIPTGQKLPERTILDTVPLCNILSGEKFSSLNGKAETRRHCSGVSGGFSKFLARSYADGGNGHEQRTYTVDDWIVKLNDSDHENIVLLEFFGMMAARKMGLPVPEVLLGPAHDRILIKRFDVAQSGDCFGFEDICALMGMPSREKFNGSVEKTLKIIQYFCEDASVQESCNQFYGQYLLSIAIRNGDAHLKNFGLLYGLGKKPVLSPVYDMLSMAVYAPANNWRDADDGMALTLGGTRRWPNAKALAYLGDLCGISHKDRNHWKERLANALLETAEEILAQQSVYLNSNAGRQVSRMLELWDHGMREIDPDVAKLLGEQAMQLFYESNDNKNVHPRMI